MENVYAYSLLNHLLGFIIGNEIRKYLVEKELFIIELILPFFDGLRLFQDACQCLLTGSIVGYKLPFWRHEYKIFQLLEESIEH